MFCKFTIILIMQKISKNQHKILHLWQQKMINGIKPNAPNLLF